MIEPQNTDLTKTTDLTFAAFLYARGVLFVGIDRANRERQLFIFKKAPDELISQWQAGEGQVNARAYDKALHFLKDELFKGRQ